MMNTLVTVFIAAYLAARSVSVLGHPSRSSLWSNKSPVADAVDSDLKAWTPLVYQGPTAVPVVHTDGTIADTPEVAAARAAHLAALETARSTNPDMDDGQYNPHKYGDHIYGVNFQSKDITNNMSSMVKSDHVTVVTAVKSNDAAKAQSAAINAYKGALSRAKASAEAALVLWKTKKTATGGHPNGTPIENNTPYVGPQAMLQLLPTGYLADTLEVTAAKNKHLTALAEAQAAEALWRTKYNRAQQRPWN